MNPTQFAERLHTPVIALSRRKTTPESHCYNPGMFGVVRVLCVVFLLILPAVPQSRPNPAPALRTKAREAVRRQDWDGALAAYQRAVAGSPGDPSLRVEMAAAFAAAGQLGNAIETYRAVLEKNPRNEAARLGLGDCVRRLHNFNEARQQFETAAKQHPQSVAPWLALGEMEIELQNYEAAISNLKQALRRDPRSVRARSEMGAAYRAKGDLKPALAELDRAIAQDPKYAMAYYVRGLAYSDQNDDAKALQDAEKALALAPDNMSARLLLAKVATRVGKCPRAVEVIQPVAETTTDSQTLFLLSRAYQCASQADEAAKVTARYTEAQKKEREDAENEAQSDQLLARAQQAAHENHLQGALDLLRQALESQPQNGNAYALRAKIQFSMRRFEEAASDIQQALSINPLQPEYFYVLGKIQERQGRPDEALESFRKATALNPRESDAFYEMGLIYKQKQDRTRAVEAFKRALAISPDDADYRQALAEISPPGSR